MRHHMAMTVITGSGGGHIVDAGGGWWGRC